VSQSNDTKFYSFFLSQTFLVQDRFEFNIKINFSHC